MGIKNLNVIIKAVKTTAISSVQLNQLKYKTIAVDISLYVHKYIAIYGENEWFVNMLNFFYKFKSNLIHLVVVFDGIPPEEKNGAKEERKKSKNKLQEKVLEIEKIKTDLELIAEREHISQEMTVTLEKLLRSSIENLTLEQLVFAIQEKAKIYCNRATSIEESHFDLIKQFLQLIGIPFIIADGESDPLCFQLAKQGLVDYVLTDDTDLLAYGTPFILRNLKNYTVEIIDTQQLFSDMELTQEMFVDMTIMLECDYNKGKKLKGYGPLSTYKLITKYGSIEKIEKELNLDCSYLLYPMCRAKFMDTEMQKINLPDVEKSDKNCISDFMKERDIDMVTIEKIIHIFYEPIE
jgi:flap endonuclease-1